MRATVTVVHSWVQSWVKNREEREQRGTEKNKKQKCNMPFGSTCAIEVQSIRIFSKDSLHEYEYPNDSPEFFSAPPYVALR